MIDVTFLLLIYFMVTMVMTPDEDHLSPTLQTQTAVRNIERAAGGHIGPKAFLVEAAHLDQQHIVDPRKVAMRSPMLNHICHLHSPPN